MATNPNKLSQFFQEIKRRNVHRLMAVYGGTAFIIFEASTMIFPRWGLPDWTIDLVLYLLILGAIITFALGWIYDINPEGGIVKTEPIEKVKADEVPKSSNSWKIASYISFVVIVGLIVLNIIPRSANKEVIDKSIAVLAFINDGPTSENATYINGYRTSVHDKLCQIQNLRVFSLQSTDRFDNESISIREMAKELGVGYLLSARGQILKNNIRLTVQLVNANDEIIWSNEYDRPISQVDDHFEIQSDIAQLVADRLEATITPEVKERIEKPPTTELIAYDCVIRGTEEVGDYNFDKAEELFNEALRYDPSYALAYAYLGIIYAVKSVQDSYSGHYLDTALYLCDIALSLDDELPAAIITKGEILRISGRPDEAISAYEKAVKLKPNDVGANATIGGFYADIDYIKSINAYHRAANISSGSERSQILKSLGNAYLNAGFEDKALAHYGQAARLDGDSAYYYQQKGFLKFTTGDFEQAIKFFRKSLEIDSTSIVISTFNFFYLGCIFYMTGNYPESLENMESALELAQTKNMESAMFASSYHWIAMAYQKNGFREEAEYFFNQTEEILPRSLEMFKSVTGYYELAGFYALRGEKEKALENLRIIKQEMSVPFWVVAIIKLDVLFDSIRDDPEFQQIVRDMEAKYQAEHERVRQWLEDNEML